MDELLNLKDEKVVNEIQDLVAEVNSIKEEIDIYCDMIKQIFLSTSNKN